MASCSCPDLDEEVRRNDVWEDDPAWAPFALFNLET